MGHNLSPAQESNTWHFNSSVAVLSCRAEGGWKLGCNRVYILTMVSLSLARPSFQVTSGLLPSLPLQGCEFLTGQEDVCKTHFLSEG